MHITKEAPPEVGRARTNKRNYQLFQALLAHPGEWLAVPLHEISGTTTTIKQSRIHAAARQRGIRVSTRTHEGKIHVMNVTTGMADGTE